MELREHMEYLVTRAGYSDNCQSNFSCDDCPMNAHGDTDCLDHNRRALLARQWLAEHPETPEPVKSVRVSKTAQLESGLYSLDLADGRLTLYRWHGKDYESVSWGGTAEDFNLFLESSPEEWFIVAAELVQKVKA